MLQCFINAFEQQKYNACLDFCVSHLHIQLNANVVANEWGLLKKALQPGFSFINMEAKISVFF